MRALLSLTLALCISSAAGAQETPPSGRFLGLLELPALCGLPCPGSDQPVPLYEAPYMERPTYEIYRDLYFEDDPDVQNQQSPFWPASDEYDRGQYGAIVYEAIDDIAYQIKIGEANYWVKGENAGPFHPYPQILEGRLAYLENWDFLLRDTPEGERKMLLHPFRDDPEKAAEIPVRILSLRKVAGLWWLYFEIYDRSPCNGTRPPFFAQGWVPALREDGARAAWFNAQGC